VKQNFYETNNRKEVILRSGVALLPDVFLADGPGSSAARLPSRAHCPGAGGFVRYQQSGFTNTALRPLRWTARRGNPGGFLD
jgi:hypothetical protein